MDLEIIDQFIEAGREAGFETTQYGEVLGSPLIALERPSKPNAPRIVLSSGIHGDEPAPVHAILELLKSNSLATSVSWTIAPLLNPSGFSKGTRENADGIDLNRDFLSPSTREIRSYIAFLDALDRIDLSLAIHEDWEATGFYVYAIGGDIAIQVARAALRSVEPIGPIETATLVDDHPAKDGLILPTEHLSFESLAQWPEAIFMAQRWGTISLTLETPSSLGIEHRVEMQKVAIAATVERFIAANR